MSKYTTNEIQFLKERNLTRRFLNIEHDVKMEFNELKKRKSNLIYIKKTKETEGRMSSNCSKDPASPLLGLAGSLLS